MAPSRIEVQRTAIIRALDQKEARARARETLVGKLCTGTLVSIKQIDRECYQVVMKVGQVINREAPL